jgi:hypothetical protein
MAEAQSIKSMLHIARIVALIFGILFILGGLADAAFILAVAGTCSAIAGGYCAPIAFLLIWPILLIIWGVFDFIIWVKLKEIEAMVDARQYEAAKAKTLVWVILGFIIGGIIVGILVLIAYLKFDPVINASRGASGGMMPPPTYAAPPAPAPAAPAPAPAMGGAPPPAPICPTCGQPGTYVAQYGRYYCYTDKQYL